MEKQSIIFGLFLLSFFVVVIDSKLVRTKTELENQRSIDVQLNDEIRKRNSRQAATSIFHEALSEWLSASENDEESMRSASKSMENAVMQVVIDKIKTGFSCSYSDGLFTQCGTLSGPAGPKGNRGKKGKKGSPGLGVPGTDGNPGVDGHTGAKGEPGATGSQGDSGHKGEKGCAGEAGLNGTVGYLGQRGVKGDPGIQGPKGQRGPPGQTGLKGQRGLQGQKGPPGQKGAIGIQGPIGRKGEKGQKG